ncbi:MAG: saccharopine dehydrogenase family protein [Candidatus Bipolaricaulota bacterium]
MKTLVLGAGRVGSAMAIDLARDENFDVQVADRDANQLAQLEQEHGIRGERVDFSLPSTVARAVQDVDLVISAVPGFLGFRTLQAVIEAGKNVVDIAFFPEDPFELDELAQRAGVTAIVDCGVAPGMSNLLVGHASSLLDKTEFVAIYVGGLPENREGPFEYRAVFSPIDVIEEYIRPARIVKDGAIVVREALSEIEVLHFPDAGDLEAFNTDGLRTLAHTIDAPNMIEKTLRYPGHAEKMQLLRDMGLFSTEPVELQDGAAVRPIDLTTKLLFPLWELKEGERDLTVMRIQIFGIKDGSTIRYTYDLFDRFDEVSGTTSMARTTGYTATVAARMLAEGLFDESGIHPPEFIGRKPECVDFLLNGLRERGIVYRESIDKDNTGG